MTELKRIKILATGGTIAGTAASASQLTGYAAGSLGVDELLASVPGLDTVAQLSCEQFSNIDSCNLTDALLLRLAKRCWELLAQDEVDGLVITHGTDTMEETAYFLQLTLPSAKPVVLVGAMRPATALSADGPLNLLNAVKTAAAAQSRGQGVLVLMNDNIYDARGVHKGNTTSTAAFGAPNGGALGCVSGGQVRYYYRSRRAGLSPLVELGRVRQLPRVDIIYGHAGEDGALIEAAVAAGARGLIYAGTGMGSIHEAAEAALAAAVRRGVLVVRSSRTGSGVVSVGLERWTQAGFLQADDLQPQKARLLLQLALLLTQEPDEVQQLFATY